MTRASLHTWKEKENFHSSATQGTRNIQTSVRCMASVHIKIHVEAYNHTIDGFQFAPGQLLFSLGRQAGPIVLASEVIKYQYTLGYGQHDGFFMPPLRAIRVACLAAKFVTPALLIKRNFEL